MIGVAQADGEDRDMPLGGDRRRLEGIRLLVVAVGDQQDRLIAVGPGLKDFEGLANRVADGRAAARCAVRVELVERSAEGVVIDGERTLHHRLPRKGDQADAFPFEPVDEGRHVGLGAAEPAGRDVLGEHRPRDVDQHVEIATAGNDVFILRPEPRPGEGDQTGHQGRFAQQQFHPESGSANPPAGSATTSPGPRTPRPPDAAGDGNRATAPARPPPAAGSGTAIRGCCHSISDRSPYGNERNRVSIKTPTRRITASPGPANQRNNSVYSEYFVSSNSDFSSLSISA